MFGCYDTCRRCEVEGGVSASVSPWRGCEGTYITGRRVVAHFLEEQVVQRRVCPLLLEEL